MELYSEQDVLTKVVVPDLAALGYDEGKKRSNVVIRYNHPIKVQQGREIKTIFADVVVFVNGTPVIVIDGKNPREYLTEGDREQVISYARLLPDIAPYAALCNSSWQIFDAVSKQQIKALPQLGDLLSDLNRRRLTQNERKSLIDQATRTLFAIDSARDLSRLMRRCHDIIRNLKGYDPTKAFDELSKVLFAKMYEEREIADGRREHNRFTLSAVKDMRKQGVEIIQTLWRDTVSSDRYREVFSDDATESDIALPPEAIDKIIAILEDKSLGQTDLDVKGVAFEEFLSSTYRGGGLGQYFTPREVVTFMVDLVAPAIGDRVIDPSCGSGGFIIRAYDSVSERIRASDFSDREKERLLTALANECLVGIDWEQRAARTCKMNMILHGDGHAGVYQANALDLEEVSRKVEERKRFYPSAPTIDEGAFDVVLTNPPFGANDSEARILAAYELGRIGKSQKREVLLLERQIRLLRPGGRLAVVIPEGILSNKGDRRIREYIMDECVIQAVIRLPQDAFKMSEGAACTSILFAVKRDPDAKPAAVQGPIFFARAEYIGISPSGKPIPQNDLLAIREQYERFKEGDWDGIELEQLTDGTMRFVRAKPSDDERLWLEPSVNRTSLLYDRLSYVVRPPMIRDRFSYTYFHPEYWRTMEAIAAMPAPATLADLSTAPYPLRGRKPSEESAEGIPILKVRNVTGHGIDLDSEYAPDSDQTRAESAKALLQRNDILITSTGEGTIGRVEIYPYDEPAIADNHVTICRLRAGANVQFVAEFLRSEYGQIQMLRHVSGSTGQTELLIDHVRSLLVPMPDPAVQNEIVSGMEVARRAESELTGKADQLRTESAEVMALGRRDMMRRLTADGATVAGATQRTHTGFEIPVGTRQAFESSLDKAAKKRLPEPPSESD
ncbi:MAG: N-6 DNA methylase [Chloroflexi bacterium]|nr:N-6 DNA methylase [Chloroflexota bacterium]